MPLPVQRFEPTTRFLISGSVLLIGILALWWVALRGPMLDLLRDAVGVFLQVKENPAGDWAVRVPFDKLLPPSAQRPIARQVHFVNFEMPRSDATRFIFSLPVYWAIILAAPGSKRKLRSLLIGTAVMAALEVARLLAFLDLTAYGVISQIQGDPGFQWGRRLGLYIVPNVLPYVLPFGVALSLHRELREQILQFARKTNVPAFRGATPAGITNRAPTAKVRRGQS
jgi:hypothetical protein